MSDQRTLWDTWPAAPEGATDAGKAGSERAAARWSPDELAAVDRAIEGCAARLNRFTADDVWTALADTVPVTKGLAARLMAARERGIIAATGMVTFSQRTGEHGHGQRLAVWRSRMRP